jgi:hypothetical protein
VTVSRQKPRLRAKESAAFLKKRSKNFYFSLDFAQLLQKPAGAGVVLLLFKNSSA